MAASFYCKPKYMDAIYAVFYRIVQEDIFDKLHTKLLVCNLE